MSAMSTTYAFAFNDNSVGATARTLLDFGFTAAQIKKADFAYMSVDGSSARFCYDGSVPTASVGHYLGDGERWVMAGQQNIERLQFIATTGTAYVAITLESFNPN